jgi:hypothetical protein
MLQEIALAEGLQQKVYPEDAESGPHMRLLCRFWFGEGVDNKTVKIKQQFL